MLPELLAIFFIHSIDVQLKGGLGNRVGVQTRGIIGFVFRSGRCYYLRWHRQNLKEEMFQVRSSFGFNGGGGGVVLVKAGRCRTGPVIIRVGGDKKAPSDHNRHN